MKKLFSIILALAMMLSLAACAQTEKPAESVSATPTAEATPESTPEPTQTPTLSAAQAKILKSGKYMYSFTAQSNGTTVTVTVAADGDTRAVKEEADAKGYRAVSIGDKATAIDLATGQVREFSTADSGDLCADFSTLAFVKTETEGDTVTDYYSCTMNGEEATLAFVFEKGKLTGIDSPESSATDICPLVEFTDDPPKELFELPDYDTKLAEALALYKAKEYEKAFPLLNELAKANYAPAMSYLGSCYNNGLGVEENKEAAVIWYKAGAAQDDARSQACLGMCYELGEGGLEKDTAKAIELYQLSAELNEPLGQCFLGRAYWNDGIAEDDYTKAMELFKASAAQGNDTAMCAIGYSYNLGIGVTKDYKQAATWYKKSADLGNDVGQYNMGISYLLGNGVTKDNAKAKEYFKVSAAQGYEDAIKVLKDHYGETYTTSNTPKEEKLTKITVGEPVCRFTAPLLDGTTFDIGKTGKKAVLIYLWNLECTHAIKEMPELQRIADKYADELIVLALNASDDVGSIRKFVKKNGYTFSFTAFEDGKAYDIYDTVFAPPMIPYDVFITPEGIANYIKIGAWGDEKIAPHVEDALGC